MSGYDSIRPRPLPRQWLSAYSMYSQVRSSGEVNMAVDRNGVTIRVNDHVTVHQVNGNNFSAVVCEVTDRPTVNDTGYWVDVDRGQGREGFPSYILEVVSTPREPEPEFPGAIEVGSRVATPHGPGTVQFIDGFHSIVACDDGQDLVYSSHRLRLLELQPPGPDPVEIRTNEDLERHLGMSWVPGEEGLPPPPAATPLAHDINGLPIFNGGSELAPSPRPLAGQLLSHDRNGRPIYVGTRVSHIAEGDCVAVGSTVNSHGLTNVVIRIDSGHDLVASPNYLTVIQETAPASQDPQPTAVDRYGIELCIGQTVRLSSIRPDDAINNNTWRGVITGITNEPSARVSRSGVLIEVRDIGHEGPLRRLLNSFDLIVVNPSSDRTSSPQPWSVPAPVDSGGVPIMVGDRVALNGPSINRCGVVTAINVSTIWVDYGRGESGPCRPSAVRVIQEWTPSQPEAVDSSGTRLEVGQWVQPIGCSGVARVAEITARRTHINSGYWVVLQTEDTRLAEWPSYNLTILSGVEESDMRVVWISGARQLPSVSDALEGKVVVRNRAGDGRYVISFIKWDAVTASHDWARGLKGFNVANPITTLAPVEDIANERSIEI